MTPSNERDVHRLLDIVVEEVSLVDRAANKHRFLIVKRSHDMDENEMSSTEDATDLNATPDDGDTGWGDDPSDASASVPAHQALAVAVEALHLLTGAVEHLSASDAAPSQPRLHELAAELRRVADHLAALAGSAEDSAGTGEAPGASDALDALLGSADEVLRQAKGALYARPSAASRTTPASRTAPALTSPAPLAKQLGALVAVARDLTATARAQQQRIAELEKRSGLPNSRPVGERSARREDVTWPLDLNQPFDRDSIDKSLSFHDE